MRNQEMLDLPKLQADLKRTLKMVQGVEKKIGLTLIELGVSLDGREILDGHHNGNDGEKLLSETQKKIMVLYRKGIVRRKFQAEALNMNPNTLDVHIMRLRKKLGLPSVHDLVVYAMGMRR